MVLETKRLFLRPWEAGDAKYLYEYAKDPLVGPDAGWFPHTSVEESRDIIRTILSAEDTYAVVLRSESRPVGSISLMIGKASNLSLSENDGEIGYWIGRPYWGRGLIPEAVRGLISYAFLEKGLETLWCGYFDGNEKSRRVQEKCGFEYHHTNEDIFWPVTKEIKTEHVTRLTNYRWEAGNRRGI